MILPPAPEDIDTILSKAYDFVIVGGGTAGLTLATLLSEDPSVNVLVIDKGVHRPGDLRILTPILWERQIGDPEYDHCYLSVPQDTLNGAPVFFSAGRTLGGTSAFNAMTWIQAPANEFAAFTELGNKDWDWETFMKYSKEVENYNGAAKELLDNYAPNAVASERGDSGRIPLTHSSFISTTIPLISETLRKLGLPTNKDPRITRTNAGAWVCQNSIDAITHERAYAANKYYDPVAGARKNLVVVTQAQVNKVLLSESPNQNGEFTATGVEFKYNGLNVSAKATREVIVSAGNITSPKILELSGIGNPAILKAAGVALKVELPSVGENFQEHYAFNDGFPLIGDYTTLDLLRDPAIEAQEREKYEKSREGLFGAGQSLLAYIPLTSMFSKDEIAAMQQELDEELKSDVISSTVKQQYKIMRRWLEDDQIPFVEVFPLFKFVMLPGDAPPPDERAIALPTFLTHPFSRGSVHVKSKNPDDQPAIDPRVYTHPLDKKIAIRALKFARDKLAKTEPLSSILGEPAAPPKGATDEELWASIISLVITGHGIGTCSMLPKENGGVVDETLKVYGTTNLRVVDCSIYPLHLSAHTASPTYAMAHKVAAYIKKHIIRK